MDESKEATVGAAPGASPSVEPQSSAATSDSPPAVDRRKAIRTDILHSVIGETDPATPPRKWRNLGKLDAVRQLRSDPCELAEFLQCKYPLDELLHERMLERGRNGELSLSPVFGDPSSKFRVWYDASGTPVNVTSARGSLSTDAPPLVQFVQEDTTPPHPYHRTSVFLATTDDEMHVSLGLGYESVSAAGLESLRGVHARALIRRVTADPSYPLVFMLPNWQIAPLVNNPASTTTRICQRLWKMEQVYDFPTQRLFEVWDVDKSEFSAIESAVEFKDLAAVRAQFQSSLGRTMPSPTDSWNAYQDRLTPSYTTALKDLRDAIDHGEFVSRDRMEILVARMRRAFVKSVGTKFYNMFVAASNPFESMLILSANELSKQWFETQDTMAAANAMLAGNYRRYSFELSEDALNSRIKISDRLLKLHRELSRDK